MIRSIARFLEKRFHSSGDEDPQKAYDLWSQTYDDQPGNLMLALDEELFQGLLNETDLNGKVIADIGCGTGRHWQNILDQHPKKIIGFDVSDGMLARLRHKFPGLETHRIEDTKLPQIENGSVDVVISTLSIAHIKNIEAALQEWARVLQPGGFLVITDYHPRALAKGANRTFKNGDDTMAITNFVHPIKKIKTIAGRHHLTVLRLEEKKIDPTMKSYYEEKKALPVYEKWKGTPIIYGILLKKTHADQ